jgi:hypothetical protein
MGSVATAAHAPMPTISRAPERTSIVVSIFAASTAGLCGTTITASTKPMREVLGTM